MFQKFIKYFESEMEVIEDKTLDKELKQIVNLMDTDKKS